MNESRVPRADVSSLLIGGAMLASFTRLLTWLYSYFLVGPVFGLLDTVIWGWNRSAFFLVVIFEVALGLGLVVTAIRIGDLENRRGRPFTSAAYFLGVVFVADTCLYLLPILAVALFRMSSLGVFGWIVLVMAVLGNLVLGAMSIVVIARCRRRAAGTQVR